MDAGENRNGSEVIEWSSRPVSNFKETLNASGKFKLLSDSIQNQLTSSEPAKLQLQYDFVSP